MLNIKWKSEAAVFSKIVLKNKNFVEYMTGELLLVLMIRFL